MNSFLHLDVIAEWVELLSAIEKNGETLNGAVKLMQWGKPVETVQLKDFENESLYRERVMDLKNYPKCLNFHKLLSNDVYACTHVAHEGKKCSHMTKVVFKEKSAEIYASGAHSASTNFHNQAVSVAESDKGMSTFLAMSDVDRLTVIGNLLQSLSCSGMYANTGKSSKNNSSADLASLGGRNSRNTSSTDLSALSLASSSSFSTPSMPMSASKVNAVVELLAAITRHFLVSSAEGSRIVSTACNWISGSSSSSGNGSELVMGLLIVKALCSSLAHPSTTAAYPLRVLEPAMLPLFPALLLLQTDRSAFTRDLALSLISSLTNIVSPHAFRLMFHPHLTTCLAHDDWRVKVASLTALQTLAPRVPKQISPLLPSLIPIVSNCMSDAKRQVQQVAIDSLEAACKSISNEDIHHLVPQLVSVIARPEESTKTLNDLLETTFVSNVDASTLALISPLLGKALRGRLSPLKRKAAKVITNMCKLVQDPSDVAPFVPMLLPALDKVIDEIVDLEVCEVVKEARTTLLTAMGESGQAILASSGKKSKKENTVVAMSASELLLANMKQNDVNLDVASVSAHLSNAWKEMEGVPCTAATSDYIASLCAHLVVFGTAPNPSVTAGGDWRSSVAMTPLDDWMDCIAPYLEYAIVSDSKATESSTSVDDPMVLSTKASKITSVESFADLFRTNILGDIEDMMQVKYDEDDGNVCNIEFSLAFGGKILLHNANLRLGRGRRYGLMGKNGAGKTTLLTNIGNGNIEGLPEHLKTVYVQHDEANDDTVTLCLLDELVASNEMTEVNVTKEEASEALTAIGFTHQMLSAPRSALSGGWKMKLLIIKAMLSKANVLLLDEPTNHLDAASVSWLTNYLNTLDDVTCLVVSHDVSFLDNIVTDIIHYESRKLVYYHGNLTNFVAIHPEAQYYYELEGSTMSFKFPVPERLDGIASTTRTVLKMDDITFTYPGASAPTLHDVSVKLCLGSRVAVLGANGAGKSTLIKLLVQENEPDVNTGGEVWKHHNLRVAYVAQHSFHHVEKHLDISPVDYIKWRFHGGVDKEDLSRPGLKLTEEEAHIKKTVKRYGDIDEILGRRKNGRTMEYECTFIGQTAREPNLYIAIEKLIEMGHGKLVHQTDARIAAVAAGLDLRPLLISEIQGHLDDFQLESEFGTHGSIRRMSGGQKVKLVLAAAMWNKPHILILDEPTNYLDRQALGALTQAIKNYGGGVLIISHNAEFTDAICTEKWIVDAGRCQTEGGAEESAMISTNKSNKITKSKSNPSLEELSSAVKDPAGGNTNKTIGTDDLLNPKNREKFSKKQIRKLDKLALAAGVPLKDYVAKIQMGSPEWAWL